MMIRCLVIGKDRSIRTVKVDASQKNFIHNKGLYVLPKEAVNLTEHADGKTESYPELIYIEGDPLPVNLKGGSVAESLTLIVTQNILRQTAKPRADFSFITDYLKHPSKILILAFVGIIVAALIGGLLFP